MYTWTWFLSLSYKKAKWRGGFAASFQRSFKWIFFFFFFKQLFFFVWRTFLIIWRTFYTLKSLLCNGEVSWMLKVLYVNFGLYKSIKKNHNVCRYLGNGLSSHTCFFEIYATASYPTLKCVFHVEVFTCPLGSENPRSDPRPERVRVQNFYECLGHGSGSVLAASGLG